MHINQYRESRKKIKKQGNMFQRKSNRISPEIDLNETEVMVIKVLTKARGAMH